MESTSMGRCTSDHISLSSDEDEDFVCRARMRDGPLPGALLEPILKDLVHVHDLENAPTDVMEEVIKLLEGVGPGIDGRGENRQGALLYIQFEPLWDKYLESHPDVRARVDPFYVIVEAPIPANLSLIVAAYDSGNHFQGPLPLSIHNTNYSWCFANDTDGKMQAMHFVGYLTNNLPGIRIWCHGCNAPFILF